MKTKQVLCLIAAILFIAGWKAPVRAQDIPVNYIQNPNMEHELNAIFWYGDWTYRWGTNGIVTHPEDYLTNLDAHSGNWCMDIPPGWIWVSYPVRGHEEKKFKASFWYRGYMTGYWNFIYRDVGMTESDLPPALVEYTGADTCWHELGGQNALRFDMWGDDKVARDGWTEDWTYFEFVWDFPGTIPGWGNTSMWYGAAEPAYLDDLYYGEWYDGHYMGEEPFGFINGDFEKTELNGEWLFNIWYNDPLRPSDYLSWTENHTEAGLQSLGLLDYKVVSIDTLDKVMPYDSIDIDTSTADRNITYYLPALGAGGKNMEMSFWHKGNAATISLDFYGNYGVTTAELPLPAGAVLYADSAHPIYEIDTTDIIMNVTSDTFTVDEMGDFESYYKLLIDTAMYKPEQVLASQNFDNPENLKLTDGAWVWSGSGFYSYDDWEAVTVPDKAWSKPEVLWLPGDPNWGGAEGYVGGIVDDTNYVWEFMYKGQLQFILNLGSVIKYDLVGDPDGIVPANAKADKNAITWQLDSKYWTQFRFEYAQGSWLADSSVTSPATVSFDLIGTYDAADLGYVDDFMVAIASDAVPDVIDTNYVVISSDTTYTYVTDTASITYNPKGAVWNLPAAAEWTEWKLTWTNPPGDIGGNLTMFLDNDLPANPVYIKPEEQTLDPDNEGWTFFDDFYYGISSGVDNKSVMKNDLHVYPNPAVDMLYLSIQIPLQKVEIFNTSGQKVKILLNPDRKVDVSDLSSGLYLLHAYDSQGTIHVVKFIVK